MVSNVSPFSTFFCPFSPFFHTFLPGTPIVGLLGQLACIMPGDDRRRECTLKRISISPPVDQEGTHTTVGLKRCLSLYQKHHMSVEQLWHHINKLCLCLFLPLCSLLNPGIPAVQSMGPGVWNSDTFCCFCWDNTDMILADKIPTQY